MLLLFHFIWKNIACLEVTDYHKATEVMNSTDETHKPAYHVILNLFYHINLYNLSFQIYFNNTDIADFGKEWHL